MARERTPEEILDQAVYAVACVAYHYGPTFNAQGLHDLRQALSRFPWFCDTHWRVDMDESDGADVDFRPRVIDEFITGLPFVETVEKSKGGQE